MSVRPGSTTPKRPPPREAVVFPLLLVVAGAAAAVIWRLASGGLRSENAGLVQWMLLILGIAGIAIALFDRQQKTGPGSGWRTQALVMLLGPTGARVVYALIGGAFLGWAIAMLTA